MRKVLVKDYMARHLITLQPNNKVMQAVHVLVENNISGAPVVDKDGQLIGILTEKDCMQVVLNSTYYSEYIGLVSDLMTTEVEVMSVEDSIVDAAKRFQNEHYQRYPVMDNNRLVGQISRADVIRALGDYWQR
jgi:predicted transcriptional regulator